METTTTILESIKERIDALYGEVRMLQNLESALNSAPVPEPLSYDDVCDHDFPRRGIICLGCSDVALRSA